jgi:hypothetical protein
LTPSYYQTFLFTGICIILADCRQCNRARLIHVPLRWSYTLEQS